MKKESTEYLAEPKLDRKLSIIVVAYNQINFTKSLVKDLMKLPSQVEIIVVDNNSSDNTEEEMINLVASCQEGKATITYIKSQVNEMHSGGCNLGLQNSVGEVVLFLNNDVRVKSDHEAWWEKVMEIPEDVLAGPTFGYLQADGSFIKESDKLESAPHVYLSGWCLAARRSTLEKLVCSRETPTPEVWRHAWFYFNDCELSHRAKKQGISLQSLPLPLSHFRMVTTKKYCDVNKLYLEGKVRFNKMLAEEKGNS